MKMTAGANITAQNDETAILDVVDGYASLLVTGTALSATVQIQARPSNAQSAAFQTTGAQVTALGMATTPFLAGAWQVKARCTAFTSATAAVAYLGAGSVNAQNQN